MEISIMQADGLHLNAQATWLNLMDDEPLAAFADGLLKAGLAPLQSLGASVSLGEMLHHIEAETNPLWVVLLALDAEITAIVQTKRRAMPVPAFVSYRARMPLDTHPLSTVRLPPLNPDGHYHLRSDTDVWVALRYDQHPQKRVLGHVRVALSAESRAPLRLHATEDHLERKTPTPARLREAVQMGGQEASLSADEAAAVESVLGNVFV